MNKNKRLVALYVFLLVISFTTKYGTFNVSVKLQQFLALVIIFVSFITLFTNRHSINNSKNIKVLNFLFKYFFIPVLLIHLYSCIMIIFGVFNKEFLCLNISSYVPILLSISMIFVFREDALKYSSIALCLSWVLSVFVSTLLLGPNIFTFAIKEGYLGDATPIGDVTRNYLELHDIVLSLGLVYIYYCIFNKSKTKNGIAATLIIIIISLLGIKRISIGAVFVVYLYLFFSEKIKLKVFNTKSVGVLIFLLSYFFVYSIIDGSIMDYIMNTLNIRVMGRNYYYSVISAHGSFDPLFLGIGRSGVTKLLLGPYSYLNVGGVHSDILKMYIENGFIVFGLWMHHYLFRIPNKIKSMNLDSSIVLYTCLIIYTFILYFTDNVENYFIFQYFLALITATSIIKELDSKEEEMS